MSRGAEIGVVVACCIEGATDGHHLVVGVLSKVATLSNHSGRWSAASAATAVWHMSEVANCLAWKIDHGEVTAILV